MGDRHYPRWVNAKDYMECADCKHKIKPGQKVYMVPTKRAFYCATCAKKAEAVEAQ